MDIKSRRRRRASSRLASSARAKFFEVFIGKVSDAAIERVGDFEVYGLRRFAEYLLSGEPEQLHVIHHVRLDHLDHFAPFLLGEILDALTGIVWEDDAQIEDLRITKQISKAEPRVELTISPLGP